MYTPIVPRSIVGQRLAAVTPIRNRGNSRAGRWGRYLTQEQIDTMYEYTKEQQRLSTDPGRYDSELMELRKIATPDDAIIAERERWEEEDAADAEARAQVLEDLEDERLARIEARERAEEQMDAVNAGLSFLDPTGISALAGLVLQAVSPSREEAERQQRERWAQERRDWQHSYDTDPNHRAGVDAYNAKKEAEAEQLRALDRAIKLEEAARKAARIAEQKRVNKLRVFGNLDKINEEMTPAEKAKSAQLQAQFAITKTLPSKKSVVNQALIEKNRKEKEALDKLAKHRQALFDKQLESNKDVLAANRSSSEQVGNVMTQDIAQLKANIANQTQTRAVQNQVISAARQKQLDAEAAQQLARQIPAKPLKGKGKSDLLQRVMSEFNMSESTAKRYIKKYGSN